MKIELKRKELERLYVALCGIDLEDELAETRNKLAQRIAEDVLKNAEDTYIDEWFITTMSAEQANAIERALDRYLRGRRYREDKELLYNFKRHLEDLLHERKL